MVRNQIIAAALLIPMVAACGRDSLQPTGPALEQPGELDFEIAAPLTPSYLKASDQFFVLLQNAADFESLAADYGLSPIQLVSASRLALYEGSVDFAALAADLRVRFVESNEMVRFSQPVEITMAFEEGDWVDGIAEAQDALAPLRLDLARTKSTGSGVRIAVLDTGVDPQHPHLASRIELAVPGTSFFDAAEIKDGIDNDLDGQIDEAFGHGTHVAGIIATVAPEATILPIRVLDADGSGTDFDVAVGLYEAMERGAHIVNLSLVFNSDESPVIHEALRELEEAGIVIVGAAGNSPGPARYPASDSHVLSVGATQANDALAPFSADSEVRVVAPGELILSSYPGGGSAIASGTSMSCAVATGCLALLAASGEGNSPHRAEELLRETALELNFDEGIKDGRVSPWTALIEDLGDESEEERERHRRFRG